MTTVATAIAHTLRAHGVDTVYCLPGEETIELLDAVSAANIEIVVTRHEQHAAFMAAAHGRLTGEPGVLITTLGPGATNAFTGLAQAQLCGFPVVMICGQKPVRNNEEGSFQVLDIPAAARPLVKQSHRVESAEDAVPTVEHAFLVATAPRPGAVLVELPEDVAAAESPSPSSRETIRAQPTAAHEVVAAIAEKLRRAERPVVLVGAGAQNTTTSRALTRFAESSGVGILATQMGKGVIPEDHALSLRTLGQNSPDCSSIAILDADLVITIGYQPVEHPPRSWNPGGHATIVHIDSALPAIEHGYRPEIVAIGDPAQTLDLLARTDVGGHHKWTTRLHVAIEAALDDEDEMPTFPPTPYDVASYVRRALGRDDIIALDNGVYKLWFARHYPAYATNTVLLDNALATMGAGLATAVVAARLEPKRHVVAILGDGGFLMNAQDLVGARELSNLTILVLRDDAYGFIAWHQEEEGRDRVAVDLRNPDLRSLADAFGIDAQLITEELSLADALSEALASEGVTLIDCPIDQRRNDELGIERYEAAMAKLEDLP